MRARVDEYPLRGHFGSSVLRLSHGTCGFCLLMVLLVTLLNITLHICYLYMLLQAHDTLDHTANNIYSFEQVDNMIFLNKALWSFSF